MEFEGHAFSDRATLQAAIEACWTGAWVASPDGGGDPTPLEWLRRLGAVEPRWRDDIVASLVSVCAGTVSGLVFAAIDVLKNADWDVAPAMASPLRASWPRLAAADSPATQGKSVLGELIAILVRSPSRGSLPAFLADELAALSDARDGAPESLLLAAELQSDPYASRLSGRFAAAQGQVLDELGAALLAWGAPLWERVLDALANADAGDRERIGRWVRKALDQAAASAREYAGNEDLPKPVRDRFAAAIGTHEARWKDAARRLGVPG